eukprot:gene14570-10416_t
MHPGYRSVTIRQLLLHRGGLLEDIGQLPSWNESLLTDPRSPTPPAGQGSAVGVGTTVRVFGMSSAGFGVPRAISTAQPQGHRMADDHDGSEESVWVVDDIDNPPVMGPAGTVHATLADL